MTVNELLRAIERRGYQVRFLPSYDDTGESIFLCISLKRGGVDGFITRPFYVKELTRLTVTGCFLDLILSPFSSGQYHMRHRCPENMAGYPLLYRCWRGVLYRGKWVQATPEIMNEVGDWPMYPYIQPRLIHEYRSVREGPASEPLTVCPMCKGEISIETVEAFDDENTNSEMRSLSETLPAEWVE